MPTSPTKTLETFPNPEPGRDYIIEIESPEFTCLCPKTGQPDFATLFLEYIPDQLCVELKAYKLYIWSFRNEGHFHEKVTNMILNDLVAATQPRYMRLRARFNVRGGVYTTVTAEHRKPGWQPQFPPLPNLPREGQSAVDPTPTSTRAPSAPATSASTSVATAPAVPTARTVPPAVAAPEPAPVQRPSVTTPPTPPPAPVATPMPATPPIDPAIESPLSSGARSDRFRMLQRKRAASPAGRAAAPSASAVEPPAKTRDIYLGLDIGTSGCRAVAIDGEEKVLAEADAPLPPPLRFEGQVTQDPNDWWKAVSTALKQVLNQIDVHRVHRLAVAGTSGTLLLCDKSGTPVTPGLMYNDRRAESEAERIASVADRNSAAHDTSGSLAKLLWLQGKKSQSRAAFALHQADWITNRLTSVFGQSDYHNALKLGYDPAAMCWPGWLDQLEVPATLLPKVATPGDVLGTIGSEAADLLGLPTHTEIVAGTTDGCAAFLASGASKPGHGVTVLGNTLVIKLLCEKQIVSRPHGVYSHRLGRHWLAGGASNSGGAVLLQYFTVEQLLEMTPLLDPDQPTDLHYYPLPDIGERFPINDPRMTPRLEPLPTDSLMFLQAILEGIARIELQGYAALAELGGPKVSAVWTTGSGSLNPAWTRIRERLLGPRLKSARSYQPAFGAALLAAGVVQRNFA